MMTLGAFVTLILAGLLAAAGISTPVPLALLTLLPAMAITAILAIGIDRIFYRPLRERGSKPIIVVMASIGVMLMLQGALRIFAGVGTRNMFFDQPKDIYHIPIPGATRPLVLTEPQAVLIAFTVIAVIALHLFLTRSRLGKAMRAMADNPDLAQLSGINTALVVRVTWIIAGALASMAGTMLALDVTLKPDLAFNIVLPIFAAAIVGGLGQSYGAIAGGFLVGFAETMAVFNWAVLLRPFKSVLPDWIPNDLSIVPTEYKLTVAFVILVIVLLVRPTGIFKGAST